LAYKHVVLFVIHVATGNRIYFDFYTSDGVFKAGHFQKPFDFKHYKINFVALNMDGRQIPAKPLQPNFENAAYIRFASIQER
jgi:hypothetical protein